MRLILADDAQMIRRGIARLLSDDGFDVIGQLSDATALLPAVHADPPDAILLDIRMPPTYTTEGLDAARAIRQSHPTVGVLILSQYIDVAYAMQLLSEREQHLGYLLKDRIVDTDTLGNALRRVHAGETVIDPTLVTDLLNTPRRPNPLDALTNREREVLAVLAEGRTDRGIARMLVISPKTVEAHVRSIFCKLDIPNTPGQNRRVHAVLTFLSASHE